MADAAEKTVLNLKKTALINIEFQNEFAHENGLLHAGVKGVMEKNNMLENAKELTTKMREAGCTIVHAPITFEVNSPRNPNPTFGILQGCKEKNFFQQGTFGAKFVEGMEPQTGDLQVEMKRGLDAFSNTNLEKLLTDADIDNVVLTGFLTNCCVESTMRTAYEKGFNVYTVPDCCACLSDEEQNVTNKSFTFFSKPTNKDEMLQIIADSA